MALKEIEINNDIYKVEVIKKRGTRNTYIRVKDDLTIYVTTNFLVPNFEIERLLKKSTSAILRMVEEKKKKEQYNASFYYLGKKYDIVKTSSNDIKLLDDKVYIGNDIDIDKWYRKQAKKLFQERFDYNYQKFSRKIPYPSLTIRKMKTRWGVCNTKDVRVTLNLDLIKKDITCLDYVINHELSHLIEANHSKRFWDVVKENYPDYKKIRKMLNDY